MSKLTFNEIRKELISCGLGYDCDTVSNTPYVGFANVRGWDHGYGTYHGYNGSRREFYRDLFEATDCLMKYISECGMTLLTVFPYYHDGPFVQNYRYCREYDDIVCEIRDFLHENGISVGTKSGAVISASDRNAVSMVLEGAFRGASRLCLFSLERKAVIEPDHHFQVSIWTPDPSRDGETLRKIISGFENLTFYESKMPKA